MRGRVRASAMVLALVLASLLLPAAAGAAPGDVLWTDQWDVAGFDNWAGAIAASGSWLFAAGSGGASGNTDWLVRAYDAKTGGVLWTKQWDLAGADDQTAAIAASGNLVLVAGYGRNASGNYDWLVRAYDAKTGAFLWSDQWDLSEGYDRCWNIGISGSRVFVAGEGNSDWLVRAYDAKSGVVLWTDQWHRPGGAGCARALVVSGNRVLVAGYGKNVSGNYDWLVRAYDAKTGAVVWTDQWDLAGYDDFALKLTVSGSRVLAAGYGFNAPGNSDWLVRAYDTKTGAVLWTEQWDLAGGYDAASIITSTGNRVLVGGYGYNASGNSDWLVRAYDAKTGAVLWTEQWDLAGDYDLPRAVAASGNRVLVAGQGTNASGNYDWLVRAYDAKTGAALWTKQWDLAGDYDAARAIALSSNGVFVAGTGTNASGNSNWLVRAYSSK